MQLRISRIDCGAGEKRAQNGVEGGRKRSEKVEKREPQGMLASLTQIRSEERCIFLMETRQNGTCKKKM